MSETTVLLLAIIITGAGLTVSAALSLAGVRPTTPRQAPRLLPVSVLCPATNDVALAKVGFDWNTGALALASCERFPTGAFECDRECFPTRILTPNRGAAAAAA